MVVRTVVGGMERRGCAVVLGEIYGLDPTSRQLLFAGISARTRCFVVVPRWATDAELAECTKRALKTFDRFATTMASTSMRPSKGRDFDERLRMRDLLIGPAGRSLRDARRFVR
jgi:hypothetical protein